MNHCESPATEDTETPNAEQENEHEHEHETEATAGLDVLSFRAHDGETRKEPLKKPHNSGLDSLGGGRLP
ncbi:hypothetical protein KVG96_15360 [Pseudomonas sp. COR58]|uniref:Uncharacterized protein n=1 Tax=Pseudomonas ekonensis TaxID=2842353 RepID=A0ABS6PFT9_9PSED|nr:hypothetical protein [Pseudomonas ekonensis]MBV4459331.1 hypothetical protein [Pseudomonas ekonensis]